MPSFRGEVRTAPRLFHPPPGEATGATPRACVLSSRSSLPVGRDTSLRADIGLVGPAARGGKPYVDERFPFLGGRVLVVLSGGKSQPSAAREEVVFCVASEGSRWRPRQPRHQDWGRRPLFMMR